MLTKLRTDLRTLLAQSDLNSRFAVSHLRATRVAVLYWSPKGTMVWQLRFHAPKCDTVHFSVVSQSFTVGGNELESAHWGKRFDWSQHTVDSSHIT